MPIEEDIVEIYVRLLEEGGTEVFRPTKAIHIQDNTYRILPTENYDPDDEIWEFLPGVVVQGKVASSVKGGTFLMAVDLQNEGKKSKEK